MINHFANIPLINVVEEGRNILDKEFAENALNEARLIVADFLDCSVAKIRLNYQGKIILNEEYCELIKRFNRRSKREPLQYISGFAYFYGEKFIVGDGVLIPRSDTEVLVEEAFNLSKNIIHNKAKNKTIEFLEFCTGSGCISISLIKQIQSIGYDSFAVATDISQQAIHYANINKKILNDNKCLEILRHDIFTDIDVIKNKNDDMGKYDLILSNPPYIESGIIKDLQPEVFGYEPHIALDGGVDGLLYYNRLLKISRYLLKSNGYILLEIGYDQAISVKDIFEKSSEYDNIRIVSDYSKNPRVLIARKI